ncbi:MAG: hypothetical protein AB1814_03585 [Thermodesulfobacteriota bacterium]
MPRCALLAGLLLAAALSLACQGGRLALPPELADRAQALSVEHSGEGGRVIRFGPFQARSIAAGPARPGRWAFLGLANFTPSQVVAFRLEGPAGGPWSCRCALGRDTTLQKIGFSDRVVPTISVPHVARTVLGCVLAPEGRGRTWRLALSSTGDGWALGGPLSDGLNNSLYVQGIVSQYQETAAGYLFSQGGNYLGAVQLDAPQQVWLPAGPLAAPVAAASAALLVLRGVSRRP